MFCWKAERTICSVLSESERATGTYVSCEPYSVLNIAIGICIVHGTQKNHNEGYFSGVVFVVRCLCMISGILFMCLTSETCCPNSKGSVKDITAQRALWLAVHFHFAAFPMTLERDTRALFAYDPTDSNCTEKVSGTRILRPESRAMQAMNAVLPTRRSAFFYRIFSVSYSRRSEFILGGLINAHILVALFQPAVAIPFISSAYTVCCERESHAMHRRLRSWSYSYY